MHTRMTNQNPKFRVNTRLFRNRERHGPLTFLETCYKTVVSREWSDFLDPDPFLATARLTSAGRRHLLPVIRQDHRGELPVAMLDWVRLYQQAHKRALRHFTDWPSTRVQ